MPLDIFDCSRHGSNLGIHKINCLKLSLKVKSLVVRLDKIDSRYSKVPYKTLHHYDQLRVERRWHFPFINNGYEIPDQAFEKEFFAHDRHFLTIMMRILTNEEEQNEKFK